MARGRREVTAGTVRRLALMAWVADNPGVSIAQAAEHFGVTPQDIHRDVEVLWAAGPQDSVDMVDFDPFEFERGYLVVTNDQGLGQAVRLTATEAQSLRLALGAVRDLVADDAELARAVSQALAVLSDGAATSLCTSSASGWDSATSAPSADDADSADSAGSEHHAGSADDVHGGGGPRAGAEPVLTTMRRALEQSRAVAVTYVNAVDERTEREIEPIELLTSDPSHIVVRAWCRRRRAERRFRLDRVLSATVLDSPVSAHLARRAGSRRATHAPVAADGVLASFVLEASGRWLVESVPHESVIEHDDGSFTVSLRGRDRDWLVATALSAGRSLRAVKPEDLAAQVRQAAREALAAGRRVRESLDGAH